VIAIVLVATMLAPADTLRFGPGIHQGPLVLERPTVVLGEPGAVLRGTGKGTVLEIRGAGSVVRGLQIERSGRNPDQYDAGVLVAADSVVLEQLVIRDVLFGVYLNKVRAVVVRGLDIAGPAGLPEGKRGDGITFYYSRDVLVQGNTIADVRDGMYFSYSDSVRVFDNKVTRVRFGLHYMFSHQNRFERNVFTDNAAGAVIMFSRGLTITDNVFAWNAGARSYGLVLQQATDPVVSGNLFVGNAIGVFFDNVIGGTFTDNLVAGNWLALQLFTNSERTVLTGNAILANTFDVAGGGTGSYQLSVNGRGNFWGAAQRRGYDLNGDGILDTPHSPSSPLAELALNRGGLRLFLESPAARVMDWAERAIPVFDVAGVVDSFPLAEAPRLAMLDRLSSAPARRQGGVPGQRLAGAAVALAGIAGLFWSRKRIA
jgi:nitrous oxidase accessory protein